MPIDPLGARVTLKIPKTPEKIGRLFVPPDAEDNYQICQGEIVARGEKVRDLRLQPGLTVITRRFGGVAHDREKTLWTVGERDVLAIVV